MADHIHVLHVLNSAHGGSALSTFQLIEELKKHNVRSSLVCFNNADATQQKKIRELVNDRVAFIPLYWTNKRTRVKWWKRPILEALAMLSTWKGHRYQPLIQNLIRNSGVNLIHTSTIVNAEGAIAAAKLDLPHVWHVRELIGPGTYYEFPRFKSWITKVEQDAHFLVANSQTTANNLYRFFQQSKVVCIPNAIDPKQYTLKVHRNTAPLVVAMVGNVTSRLKNHELFIRTAVHFRNRREVKFHIYGSLPSETDGYYAHLMKIVQMEQISQTLKFMGHQDDASVFMSDIDVLFHPTGLESFGRIFIEAMASGIPVIGLNEGGASELVRDGVNGYTVDKNNIGQIAETIDKLLHSGELRNQLGKNGRSIVESEYNLSHLATRMVSQYQQAINQQQLGQST